MDSVTRFLISVFFHQSTSPRPLIHGTSLFAYGFEFAKIFNFEIAGFGLSGVNDTAGAENDPLITPIFFV
jgi:hypothetical protein